MRITTTSLAMILNFLGAVRGSAQERLVFPDLSIKT